MELKTPERDPGVLVVESFLSEEQEARILKEMEYELGFAASAGSGGPGGASSRTCS